jgi:pimeloyl-ACP methyl ester carboxylesterase
VTDSRSDFTAERRPVVLVPGLSGAASKDFSFLSPMLARRHDVTVVPFDDVDASSTLGDLADRIHVVVERCAQQPAVIGYSLGAVAAVAYAAAHPSGASSLTLVAGWLTPSAKLRGFADVWRVLHAEGSPALPGMAMNALFSADGWDSARPPLISDVSDALTALSATADVAALASAVTVPVLVVGCALDEVATTRQSKLLFGALANARYAEVHSGHAVVHERPAELLNLINAFLTRPALFPAGSLILEERP